MLKIYWQMFIANEMKKKKQMTIEKFIFDLAIVSSFFVACIRHQMKYNANADECVTQLPQ